MTSIDDRPDAAWLPDEFCGLEPLGPTRGADVTRRSANRVASGSRLMVGDAAAVLDPASSHGVLKAIPPGIATAHLIDAVLARLLPPKNAAAAYQSWLRDWLTNDAAQVAALYREIGIRGLGAPLRIQRGGH